MTQPAAIAPVTQLSTIDPAPEAAPEPKEAAPPVPAESGTASVAADPPAPAAPSPVEDKSLEMSKRLEDVAKRTARVRRLESEAQAAKDALAKREEEIAAKLAELDAALEDPIDYYTRKGKDPVEIAQRFVKPVTPEEKRVAALEQRLADREAADKKAADERDAAQAERNRQATHRTFVASITPDECPNLTSLYKAQEIPGLVSELLNRVDPRARDEDGRPDRRTLLDRFKDDQGRLPTDAELRNCLEHEAKIRATDFLSAQRAAQPVPTTPPATPDEGAGPATIGNQHGSTSASPKRRPLSLEERRKADRARLIRDLEAEAAERKSE